MNGQGSSQKFDCNDWSLKKQWELALTASREPFEIAVRNIGYVGFFLLKTATRKFYVRLMPDLVYYAMPFERGNYRWECCGGCWTGSEIASTLMNDGIFSEFGQVVFKCKHSSSFNLQSHPPNAPCAIHYSNILIKTMFGTDPGLAISYQNSLSSLDLFSSVSQSISSPSPFLASSQFQCLHFNMSSSLKSAIFLSQPLPNSFLSHPTFSYQ